MSTDNPIIVEPITESGRDGNSYSVVIGSEGQDFLGTVVPAESREDVLAAAVSILSKSVSPLTVEGQETGLVIGYVQSGKTMSFEMLTALACDNGFQMVIVVAGTSNTLLEQSTGRLCRDLQLDEPERDRRWLQFQNPSHDEATVQAIQDVLEDWNDPETPVRYKKTILITVLKFHTRLRDLTAVLSAVGMHGVPVLIIDDEADQVSLNTGVAQGIESTTYSRLMELRGALPNHTFLQYTATPQAPLLVSIIDSLSPNFVQVLNPGNEYVGGREFFGDNSELVRVIPPEEVPTNADPLNGPPDTLLDALHIFMVGVTAGVLEGRTGNRSMLVHPSHRTGDHQEYHNWVRNIFGEWRQILKLPDDDPDKRELIDDLKAAYNDLAETVETGLPPFDVLLPSFRRAFRNTRILEVNTREDGVTPRVDWRNTYAWVLVGGQAMDRGVTIEGLTVAYIPRGIGVGNADTIQQRARFFGYKRRYIGYCRVYLEQATLYAFQHYVEHEQDMRNQLQEIQEKGKSLNEWKRAFMLDPALRPCRHNVLEFDYIRGRLSDSWFAPHVVLATSDVIEANRSIINAFVPGLTFIEDEGHSDRREHQRHHVCENVSLRSVIENLLVRLRITGLIDSERNTGLLLQLIKALEDNPNERCTIYCISPSVRRRRRVNENGEVTNLFQAHTLFYHSLSVGTFIVVTYTFEMTAMYQSRFILLT